VANHIDRAAVVEAMRQVDRSLAASTRTDRAAGTPEEKVLSLSIDRGDQSR